MEKCILSKGTEFDFKPTLRRSLSTNVVKRPFDKLCKLRSICTDLFSKSSSHLRNIHCKNLYSLLYLQHNYRKVTVTIFFLNEQLILLLIFTVIIFYYRSLFVYSFFRLKCRCKYLVLSKRIFEVPVLTFVEDVERILEEHCHPDTFEKWIRRKNSKERYVETGTKLFCNVDICVYCIHISSLK